MKEFFRDIAQAIENGGPDRFFASAILVVIVFLSLGVIVVVFWSNGVLLIPVVVIWFISVITKRWAGWMLRK